MLMFLGLALLLILLDVFVYVFITVYESQSEFSATWGTPNTLTRDVGEELERQDDGSFALPASVEDDLRQSGAWAILIGNDGEVIWQSGAPDSALRTYTLSDTAVFMRYGYLDDHPCFIWQRDEGLVVCAFPEDSYVPFPIRYIPMQTFLHLPLYILGVLLLDAAVVFLVYSVSKRRVLKSVGPVVESLEGLAQGRPVHVETAGDLREVGESINAASAVMRRKDEARKRWVSGVSHDIRTPLAISMGHAESIAHARDASPDIRKSAETILRQSERIRDLVADLNIASKLEYDMQPLDVQPCSLSKTVRSVAADYLNDGLDERYEMAVDIAPDAEGVRIPLDERLMKRALRNLVDNAVRHNEGGCRIGFALARESDALRLRVSDDGCGLAQEAIARLNHEAASLMRPFAGAEEKANGPVPPPHFEEYAQEDERGRRSAAQSGATPAHPITPQAARPAPDGSARKDAPPTLARTELGGFNEHGLGLSLVARIAIAHGGTVEFDGGPHAGFSATIALPLGRE